MTQALTVPSTQLENYNPREHLVKWTAFDKSRNKSVTVEYYPAAWRLYELRLRYPSVTIETEVIAMDIERDFVLIKAWIFTGDTYATSVGPGHKRASSGKQGKLSIYDKIETAAKSRAARDMGISTELALDMDDGEVETNIVVINEGDPHGNPKQIEAPKLNMQPVDELKRFALKNGFITGKSEQELIKAWKERLYAVFQRDVTDAELAESEAMRATLKDAIERYAAKRAAASKTTVTSGK